MLSYLVAPYLPRDLYSYFIQVKTIFVPTGASLTSEVCAPLVATLPLEVIPVCCALVFRYALCFCGK